MFVSNSIENEADYGNISDRTKMVGWKVYEGTSEFGRNFSVFAELSASHDKDRKVIRSVLEFITVENDNGYSIRRYLIGRDMPRIAFEPTFLPRYSFQALERAFAVAYAKAKGERRYEVDSLFGEDIVNSYVERMSY